MCVRLRSSPAARGSPSLARPPTRIPRTSPSPRRTEPPRCCRCATLRQPRQGHRRDPERGNVTRDAQPAGHLAPGTAGARMREAAFGPAPHRRRGGHVPGRDLPGSPGPTVGCTTSARSSPCPPAPGGCRASAERWPNADGAGRGGDRGGGLRHGVRPRGHGLHPVDGDAPCRRGHGCRTHLRGRPWLRAGAWRADPGRAFLPRFFGCARPVLVGCDGLTPTGLPVEDIASAAMDCLLRRADRRDAPPDRPQHVMHSPVRIEPRSTAPPPVPVPAPGARARHWERCAAGAPPGARLQGALDHMRGIPGFDPTAPA